MHSRLRDLLLGSVNLLVGIVKNAFEYETELSALREELAACRQLMAGSGGRIAGANEARYEAEDALEACEKRNAESSASMQSAAKLMEQMLSSLNPRRRLAVKVREFLSDYRNSKPTESGASE